MIGTTVDAFLGGRLMIRQPAGGYRAGADPVFLAAAVPARAGDRVLELGCGAGVALLCLLARVSDLQATGVERDPVTADLARLNARHNGHDAQIVTADLNALPQDLREQSFDHVLANPPFFDRTHGSKAHVDREGGRGEDTPLATWIDTGIRRLAPGGTFTLIQRANRLPDLLAAMDTRLGDITLLPLAPRQGRAAKLVLVQAQKGAKGPFQLAPPFILHDGERHERDGESYSSKARDVLRENAPITLRQLISG